MDTRWVLTVVWLLLTLFLGLIQVPMGTLAHFQSARRTDKTARLRASFTHSLSDLHLFVFSIATSGGIMIAIFGSIIEESATSSAGRPWHAVTLLTLVLACIVITLLSGICWATNKATSPLPQLGAGAATSTSDAIMIKPSMWCAGAAIAAGVVTELVK
jgi:hypothetical protein